MRRFDWGMCSRSRGKRQGGRYGLSLTQYEKMRRIGTTARWDDGGQEDSLDTFMDICEGDERRMEDADQRALS